MFEALYHRTAKVLEREVPMNSIVKVNILQIFLMRTVGELCHKMFHL